MLSNPYFVSLVKDTLLYFKQEGYFPDENEEEMPPQTEHHEFAFSLPKKVAPKTLPNLSEKVNESFSPTKDEKPLPSNWPLFSHVIFSDLNPLKEKFGKFFTLQALEIPVKLILPEENEAHRLFLENVSRAITKNFAPSSVELASQFDGQAKFVLAPKSFLAKKIPISSPHSQLYLIKETAFLVLEELDHYLVDRNLKLTLWQAIKTHLSLQNTFRSS